MPYNFKKLLKRADFSGHVNYSAPELILEKPSFSNKVDIWALGCCLYYILYKRDPFEGKEPMEVKNRILNFTMHTATKMDQDQPAARFLVQACLNFEDTLRPSTSQLLQTIRAEIARMKGEEVPDATI